jgi:pyruvate kinase
MTRRTKIVCTLGPASSDRETIGLLVEAGMDVARLNFSHGTHDGHAAVIALVRSVSAELGRMVAILQDLQGPKIRVGAMQNDAVLLHKGAQVILTADDVEDSDGSRIHVSYPDMAQEVGPGGRVLLDDGLLELVVREVRGEEVYTEVIVGGALRSNKGVHLPLLRNSRPSLTAKDIADLEFGLAHDVDIVALSFVRSEVDVAELVGRIRASGKSVQVIAKIEKPEAVDRVDEILAEADGLMVARGDLGIEMPLERVPTAQKRIIRRCMRVGKPVITATQMLESMMDNPRPTRAETSDVANAVLDGSDAVMLSGETAAGKYPVRTVEIMSQIIVEAEKQYALRTDLVDHAIRARTQESVITDSVSYTAYELAEHVGAAAICCLTASGATARSIARHRPRCPVYAFTDAEHVVRQLAIVWGTKGFAIPFQYDTDHGIVSVKELLLKNKLVAVGERVVITAGLPLPTKGRTNMIHVSTVE